MLILERTVTRPFSSTNYRWLFRKIQKGQFERVSGSVIKVQYSKNELFYVITANHRDELRPVAWLYLWRKPKWVAYEPLQVFTMPMHRGLGLSKKLYKAAVIIDGIILASGKTQTSASMGLWKSFVKSNTFDIYAIDYWDMGRQSQVFWDKDQDEVWCSLDVYFNTKQTQTQDIRFIATRKR